MENIATCFRCGQEGHLRSQCPGARPLPAPSLASGRTALPPRLDDKPVPPHLPPDPELAHGWARDIREAMGWDKTAATRDMRQIAADQVQESRARRLAHLG